MARVIAVRTRCDDVVFAIAATGAASDEVLGSASKLRGILSTGRQHEDVTVEASTTLAVKGKVA